MMLNREDESTPGSERWPFFYECTTLKMCDPCALCLISIALRVSVCPPAIAVPAVRAGMSGAHASVSLPGQPESLRVPLREIIWC